jgi:gliding motility-associated-like protein
VPNAFTPNSDDDNEFFKAYSLESFLEFRLDIFDQWGSIIYTSTDIERQWDGTSFEGSDLPIGTYVWKITYKSQFELGIEGAPTRTLAGRVNLIR